MSLQIITNQSHAVTLCIGVEIKSKPRVVLDDAAVFDAHLVHSDKLEHRIQLLLRRFAEVGVLAKTPGVDKRAASRVKKSVGEGVHTLRLLEHRRNYTVGRNVLIVVDFGEERLLVVRRNRIVESLQNRIEFRSEILAIETLVSDVPRSALRTSLRQHIVGVSIVALIVGTARRHQGSAQRRKNDF